MASFCGERYERKKVIIHNFEKVIIHNFENNLGTDLNELPTAVLLVEKAKKSTSTRNAIVFHLEANNIVL